uniref:DUF547 domain-containing protein n=1 Tax=Vannella robusta TaxID=1487602 RepID=A0A7S4M8I8_9EUKA|mmetsp:Transcript_14727/g.18635  ORF Transcript_14727/g.18635 Transcript_14727/m.18635 type:complete len:288 (+) Transcript_14727:16-879(+)
MGWQQVFVLFCFVLFVHAQGNATFDHSDWQFILDKYLHENATIRGINETAFDYEGLRRNMDVQFTNYINSLNSLSSLNDYSLDEQWAILINAYNVFAVNMIIENPTKLRLGKLNWPIKSIRDISGFFTQVWDLPAGYIAGQEYTMNQVETMVRDLNDPRIHACVVCASASCPDLQTFAFTGPGIDAQKNYSMTHFLQNTGKGLRIDSSNNIMYVSSIFNWYADDFENDNCTCLNGGRPFQSVEAFILTFAPPSVRQYYYQYKPSMQYLSYDWHMNAYSTSGGSIAYW